MRAKQAKVAIVTGGASGIGRAVVLRLLNEGFRVIVCDINATPAEVSVTEEASKSYEFHNLDVSRPDMVSRLFKEIFERFGRIDVLVNCAGITFPSTLLVNKNELDFRKIIDVHLMGTFYCMKHAANYMIQRNFGRIINISSRAGVFGLYGKADYSAAKAAIIGLTLTAAKELFKKGITVNAIAPAAIRTPLSMKNISKQKKRRARLDMVVGEPSDVADLVFFLSKETSHLINGSVIILDAGGHLWHGMDDKFSRMAKG